MIFSLWKEIKKKSGIVISAGPSLHKLEMLKKIKDSDYTGSIISIDGSYLKCLKMVLSLIMY